MKRISLLLFFLVFSFGISTTVSGSGLYANPMPSDSIDYLLTATRSQLDSTIHTWYGKNYKEVLRLTYTEGEWTKESINKYRFNDDGLLIESGCESIIPNFLCDSYRHFYEYNSLGQRTLFLTEVYSDDQWQDYKRTTYEYGLITQSIEPISAISQYFNGTEWTMTYESKRIFDEKNRLLLFTSHRWENGLKILTQKHESIYDENDNLIFEERFNYPYFTTNMTFNPFKDEYEYNASNQLIRSISYFGFDESTNEWTRSNTINYSYNQEGQLIKENSNGLIIIYEYDENNHKSYELLQRIEQGDTSNSRQMFLTYDSLGNHSSFLSQRWNEDYWVNNIESLIEYDALGNRLASSQSKWNDSTQTWFMTFQHNEVFDKNNQSTYSESTIYNNGEMSQSTIKFRSYYEELSYEGQSPIKTFREDKFTKEEGWIENYKYSIFYRHQYENEEDPIFEQSFSISPNPSTDRIRILMNEELSDDSILNIYSMNGQLMYTQAIPSGFNPSIQLPNIPQGMYVVKVSDGANQKSSLLQIK